MPKTIRYKVTIKNLRVQKPDDSILEFPNVIGYFDFKGKSALDYRRGDEERFIQTRQGARVRKIRTDYVNQYVIGFVKIKDLSFKFLSYEVESVLPM